MKIRNFLPLAALALPLLASARPAAPGLRTLTNADGTKVEAYVHGDESFSWVVSADGKTLLEYSNGRWAPAMREGKALTAVENNVIRLRDEKPAYELENPNGDKKRMAPLDPNGRTTFPTLGDDVHACIVLIEYADVKFTVPNPVQTFTDMCNKEGFSDYNAKGSVRDYYIASSNGKFKPTFDIYGPVEVSHPAAYYVGAGSGLPGDGSNAYFGYAIEEALKKLDPTVDFSKYDYDEDGKIDNIFFFYAGFGQADSHDKSTIWPHQSDWSRYTHPATLKLDPITLDGKKFSTYACSNELQGGKLPAGYEHPYLDGIGACAHEFTHVLGLPDLYDVDYKGTATPGDWSIMANGTYNDSSTRPPLFSAYEQWVCRWLEFNDLTPEDNGHYEVPSLSVACMNGEEPVAYRLRIPRPGMSTFYQEFFVVETRTKDGWDLALPNEGILIWHIDYDRNKWINNQVNVNGVSRATNIKCGTSDVWPYMGDGTGDDIINTIYTNGPAELPVHTSGADFHPVITNIAFDPETKMGAFDYNMCEQLEDVTVLYPVTEVSEATREFKLTWDKVEGVENYYVTIFRTQGTKQYTVDGYDEKAVGDVNEIVVRNISPSAWGQWMTAYVRCGNEIPGKNSSNVIRFKLSDIASVSDIISDGTVKGGYGSIEAPEGARVFNTSGVETGTENLPAGMYIVVLDGKSVKVVVK